MKPELFLRLAEHEWFWKFRRRAYLARFAVSRLLFGTSFGIGEYRKNIGLIGQFARISVTAFLAAIAAAFALHFLDNYFLVLSWKVPVVPSPDRYVAFMAAVAQIGGVFIGLYYAGVTAAAGAIYSQTPSTVRNLLVRERVGNVYTLFLTFVTFLPLVLIALEDAFSFAPPRLAMPFVCLMVGVGIIAFVQLGKRAFELFDPTKLSYTVFSELNYWSDNVVAGGYKWQERSFQSYAHARGAEALSALETVSEYSLAHHSLRREPLIALTTNILQFLLIYTEKKHRIPTQSFWYQRTYAHPDWFRTVDSTVQIATQTGTFITPTEVPKKFWIEDRLEPLVLRCFEANATSEGVGVLLGPGKYVVDYVSALAEQGEVARAFGFAEKFRHLVCATLPETNLQESEFAGFADFVAHLAIAVLLGTSRGIQRRDPDEQRKRLERVNWSNPKSIYLRDFPSRNLPELEWLQERICRENVTEGQRITPNWYCLTYVLLGDDKLIAESAQKVLAIDDLFVSSAKQLLSKRPEGASAILSRALEYLSKLEHRIKFIAHAHEKLKASQQLSGLPWPKIEPETWSVDLEKGRNLVLEQVLHAVPKLIKKRPDGTSPDYRGQFIQLLAEDLMKRLMHGDVDQVKRIFPVYSVASLSLFDALRPSVLPEAPHLAESELHLATAPVIDLLDVSGYARLFSEYHQNAQLWAPVGFLWNKYIQGNNGGLNRLAAIISLGNIPFHLPHRGMLRTNWQIAVQRHIRQTTGGGVPEDFLFGRRKINHPSPLVRYFARSDFTDGVDIIVGDFLFKLPGGELVSWGQQRPQDFQDAIDQETGGDDEV